MEKDFINFRYRIITPCQGKVSRGYRRRTWIYVWEFATVRFLYLMGNATWQVSHLFCLSSFNGPLDKQRQIEQRYQFRKTIPRSTERSSLTLSSKKKKKEEEKERITRYNIIRFKKIAFIIPRMRNGGTHPSERLQTDNDKNLWCECEIRTQCKK